MKYVISYKNENGCVSVSLEDEFVIMGDLEVTDEQLMQMCNFEDVEGFEMIDLVKEAQNEM